MNIAATIEARMASTRLPGKVLRPLLGRPLLERMIERLRRVPELSQIIVATTTNPQDHAIEELCGRLGVGCFRGSEEDVLDRVLQAARSYQVDVIVETTGDCPLIDPGTIRRAIAAFNKGGADYCSNVVERTYPRGMEVQVFPTAVLAQVASLTQDPADREHVSLYIYQHPERFRLRSIFSGLPERHQNLRLTVDTAEDLALIERVFQELYPRDPAFDLHQIVELFDTHPQLAELNRHIRQKAVH